MVSPIESRAVDKAYRKWTHRNLASVYRFPEATHSEEPNFFSNLFESSRHRYEQMMKHAPEFEFHPVQDLKNLMAETATRMAGAEESAKATASHMYETLIPSGSTMDKQLSAMGHATYTQFVEAWNSVKDMKDRLEVARLLADKRQRIRQQLKGYRVMLNRLLDRPSAVPADQMATLMRRITTCNEALEQIESRAQTSFAKITGFTMSNLPFFQRSEPQRFAKYSTDPLLGIVTYPLGFNLLILGLTEVPVRIMLFRRGFERRSVGMWILEAFAIHFRFSNLTHSEFLLNPDRSCIVLLSSGNSNK